MQEQAALQRETVRILFVDDEPNILLTMPAILRQHGYEVTAVGTVSEALTQITTAAFDVLISDLNIGHAGRRLYCGQRNAPNTADVHHSYPDRVSGI